MKTTPLNSILIILLLAFPSLIVAQQGRGGDRYEQNREKIETYKIAFITDKLALSPEEAEKFWPVYNENRDRVELERKLFLENNSYESADIDTFTTQEANNIIMAKLAHEQKILDMKKKFHQSLLTVLSSQKTLKLFEAEKEFRVELMRRAADNGRGKGRQGR